MGISATMSYSRCTVGSMVGEDGTSVTTRQTWFHVTCICRTEAIKDGLRKPIYVIIRFVSHGRFAISVGGTAVHELPTTLGWFRACCSSALIAAYYNYMSKNIK